MLIDRYLLRQLFPPLAAVLLILSSLFVTFTLARLLTDAGEGALQLSEVLRVTWLRWLIAQDVLLPISLYLSVILLWGRLYQDLEMDALAAGGLGPARLALPMLAVAVPMALAVAAFTTEVRPWAWQQVYRIKADAEASAELERIRSARFNTYDGNYTVFIEGMEPGGKLEGVFVHRREHGEYEMVSALTGHFIPYVDNDSHQLLLRDALALQTFDDGRELYGRFASLTLKLKAATPKAVTDKPKVKSLEQLAASPERDDSAELQWRLSAPVTVVLLVLAAIPLAKTAPRQSRYARIIIALGIYAVYFNLAGVARTWVEQGETATLAWVQGALAVIVALLWGRGPLAR